MESNDLFEANDRLGRADNDLDRAMEAMMEEIGHAFGQRLIDRFGMNPATAPHAGKAPDPDIARIDGSAPNARMCWISIPIHTALRHLMDGRAKRAEEWLSVMRREGYADEWDSYGDAIRDERAMAFSNGLDDFRIADRDPEKRMAKSERACPGFGEHYDRGRMIEGRTSPHAPWSSFGGDWARMALRIDGGDIDFCVAISHSRMTDPDSEWDHVFEVREGAAAEDLAQMAIDVLCDSRDHRQENVMRPGPDFEEKPGQKRGSWNRPGVGF